MNNIPEVKLGVIAVSRDCFPIALSIRRRQAVCAAYKGELYECPVTVENEADMMKAAEDVRKAGCNALVVFLGNFGPETPETLLARSDVEQLIGDRTIGMIVVDEAHIVTTWGKQFRPDYWYLGDHIKKLRKNRRSCASSVLRFGGFCGKMVYNIR